MYKMIPISGFLAALECIIFVLGRDSARDPILGEFTAPQTLWFKGPYF